MVASAVAAPTEHRRASSTTPASVHRSDRRHHLLAGARAMAPWLLGVAPFGLVIGVSAARADIPTLAGWLTGPLIFGGSAQVATIQLLDSGAAPAVAIVAGLAVNLRLVLYSATMARHWQGAPHWWQALAADRGAAGQGRPRSARSRRPASGWRRPGSCRRRSQDRSVTRRGSGCRPVPR